MYVSGIIRSSEIFSETSSRHDSRRKKWLKLSKHYAINNVEQMNIYNMYKLLCIIYTDHHLMHCAFCYVTFWKSWLCSSTTATSRKHVTNRLRCRFQTTTYTKVVKASTWKLLYMILIKIKCAWHLFCEVWHMGSRVMPLFWNWYIHIEKVSVSNFFNSFQIIFNFVHDFPYFLWQSWDRGYTHHNQW